jgi:hypothetical protein
LLPKLVSDDSYRGRSLLPQTDGRTGPTPASQAVAQALELHGVAANPYRTIGLGESYPVASNDTAAGSQQNRRVDVVFSNTSGRFSEAALSRQGKGATRR